MVIMLGGTLLARLWLGACGVGVIMCSTVAGFGFVAATGVPFTDISLMIVFVVVGIGVDDMIVIVDFLHAQEHALTAETRLSRAIAEAGSSILVTSLTNLVAFLCAATIDLPGVRSFCLAAGVIVFILFILTVTLFAAALGVTLARTAPAEAQAQHKACMTCGYARDSRANHDGRPGGMEPGCCCLTCGMRRPCNGDAIDDAGNGHVPSSLSDFEPALRRAGPSPAADGGCGALDGAAPPSAEPPIKSQRGLEIGHQARCCACYSRGGKACARGNINSPEPVVVSCRRCYSRALSRRPVGILAILSCVAVVLFGFVMALPRLQVGVDFQDNFPDGSYVSAYFLDSQHHFGSLADRASLIFFTNAPESPVQSNATLDWADEASQTRVRQLVAQLNALDVTTEPFVSWLDDYLAYAARNQSRSPTSGPGFYAGLREWLARDQAECADDECARYVLPKAYSADIIWAGDGSIAVARFRGFVRAGASVQSRIEAMNMAKDALHAHSAGLPVVLFAYYYVRALRDRGKEVTRRIGRR